MTRECFYFVYKDISTIAIVFLVYEVTAWINCINAM